MSFAARPLRPEDHARVSGLVIAAFEPITYFRKLDQRFGPLGGMDWRARWEIKVRKAFETEIALVGEEDGSLAAFASGTLEAETGLAFLDLLAVDPACQGKGYGGAMLRLWLDHVKGLGATSANLDCLTDNDNANDLYRSEGFVEVARQIRWFKKLE